MICMYEDYDYHEILKECAEIISGKWFEENHLEIVGTKIVGNYMYVKGFDGGFPHASAYVKIDLKERKIVNYYNTQYECPVEIKDGVYE